MCTQKPPHDYSEQLYNKYREAFNTYINEKVCDAVWLCGCAAWLQIRQGLLVSSAPAGAA